jgi:hypothetical protein
VSHGLPRSCGRDWRSLNSWDNEPGTVCDKCASAGNPGGGGRSGRPLDIAQAPLYLQFRFCRSSSHSVLRLLVAHLQAPPFISNTFRPRRIFQRIFRPHPIQLLFKPLRLQLPGMHHQTSATNRPIRTTAIRLQTSQRLGLLCRCRATLPRWAHRDSPSVGQRMARCSAARNRAAFVGEPSRVVLAALTAQVLTHPPRLHVTSCQFAVSEVALLNLSPHLTANTTIHRRL